MFVKAETTFLKEKAAFVKFFRRFKKIVLS